jgi:excisionase family DNA binding protein
MSESDAAEVTVVNADSWLARTEQLAVLLSTAADGDVIPDAEGNPADPQRIIALSGLPYWSENPGALHGALNEIAGNADARPTGPDLAPGAVGWGPERLTLTVEEVAATLGISLSHAYEAIRRGEIPSIRIGRRVLVPRAALERLLEGGSPQPPSA